MEDRILSARFEKLLKRYQEKLDELTNKKKKGGGASVPPAAPK